VLVTGDVGAADIGRSDRDSGRCEADGQHGGNEGGGQAAENWDHANLVIESDVAIPRRLIRTSPRKVTLPMFNRVEYHVEGRIPGDQLAVSMTFELSLAGNR
jgi:hypothetical protein